MKYAVEVGSSVTMYIQSFIMTGSGIGKLTGWEHIHTQTARLSHKPTF
jgi:hypothetical protein